MMRIMGVKNVKAESWPFRYLHASFYPEDVVSVIV